VTTAAFRAGFDAYCDERAIAGAARTLLRAKAAVCVPELADDLGLEKRAWLPLLLGALKALGWVGTGLGIAQLAGSGGADAKSLMPQTPRGMTPQPMPVGPTLHDRSTAYAPNMAGGLFGPGAMGLANQSPMGSLFKGASFLDFSPVATAVGGDDRGPAEPPGRRVPHRVGPEGGPSPGPASTWGP
jgi:hypothetical protein